MQRHCNPMIVFILWRARPTLPYSLESNYIQSFFLNNFATKHWVMSGQGLGGGFYWRPRLPGMRQYIPSQCFSFQSVVILRG